METDYVRELLATEAARASGRAMDPDRVIAVAMRRHRRRRNAALGFAAAIVTATGVGLATDVGGSANGGRATVIPAAPTSASPSRRPVVTPRFAGKPTWLPPGARLTRQSVTGAAHVLWYGLAGPANANNIPFGGATEQNYAAIHPATYIEITSAPATSPSATVTTQFQQRIIVSGHRGTLTTTQDPQGPPRPGATRIDWIANGTAWSVLSLRLNTPDGLSGIDTTDLLRVAQSLHT